MQSLKYGKLALLVVVLLAQISFAGATFTVSKGGDGQFTTIQEAVDHAGVGDEIIILDTETYEEQVTIDSTKDGLTLRSQNPKNATKPVIKFQDKINVGPTTADEALVEESINFDRNGALQVLGALKVTIDGIAIDGGGVYPFGYDAIWESKFALQHGNAALCLWVAGETVVRNCDIRNAYFGISIKDRNEGGVFANPNPADIDTARIVPFSGFAQTGNHLIEYNRIHDNSFGMFFESTWDMGSTVRYNLIYECHHKNAAMAAKVKGLTSEGGNQPGGAFMFKDHMLSPLAIYNNTFWHNALMFIGNWKTAPIHLIFNNIIAEPVEYWGQSDMIFGDHMECTALYVNRMHNSVIAAQQQAPTSNYTTITNDLKPVQSAGGTFREGALITPFPSSADIRWVETQFLSTDPDDPSFLEPDWSDPNVMEYIVDKGWEEAGVRDPDQSRADLGAIPMGGGRPNDIITIKPTKPILVNGTSAQIGFQLTPRTPSSTMSNIEVKMFGIVLTEYDVKTADDIFGSNGDEVPATSIRKLDMGSYQVKLGDNETEVTIPASLGDFAFLELIVEGVGQDGLPFTSSVGFLPYRKLDYMFEVTVHATESGPEIKEVTAGDPVFLKVKALRASGQPFNNTVDPTTVNLQSGFELLTPDGLDTIDEVPGGVTIEANVNVMFTKVPLEGLEFVHVAGYWIDGDKVIAFLGSTDGIKVRPGPAEKIAFQDPPSGMTRIQNPGEPFRAKVQAYDHWDNKVDQATSIKCISLKKDVGDVVSDSITDTDTTGLARFTTQVTMGGLYDTFPLVATLMQAPNDMDTAFMVVGQPRDRLFIFFDASAPYDETDEIHGCAGDRVPVTIRASKDGATVSTDRVTAFTIDLSAGLAAYADDTSMTKITTSQLTAGEAVIWIQAVAKNVSNGSISAIPADGAVKELPHSGIYFDPCYKTINHAAYFTDNGMGSVNRVEIYYDSALVATEVPDSIRLFWPDELTGMYMARGDEIVLDANDKTHITVTLTTPFPENITRFSSGGSNAQLGTTLWSNPLTPEVTAAQPQPFAIADSVGPLLASAMLIERVSAGSNDSLVISFTEPVAMDVVAGASLELIKNGTATTLTVASAGLYSDGVNIVAVVPVGNVVPAEGDSLRIVPAGPIVDVEGNHAHQLNRPVVITLSKVPPSISNAIYQDINGDGVIDNVKITFNKTVALDSMYINTIFDNMQASGGEAVGVDHFAFDETMPNTVNFRIDADVYRPEAIKNKTSQPMQITATFINYTNGDNNESSFAVIDGAAPVLVALEYHFGKYTVNGKEKDTIVARYSETLTAVPGVSQPFTFIDTNDVSYTATVSGAKLSGSDYLFVVEELIPATVIPFGPNVGSDSNGKEDSAWINVAVSPEANAVDGFNNVQMVAANSKVPVFIKRPPFELDVKYGPNPLDPDDVVAGNNDTKMNIRVKAVGDIAVNTNFVVNLMIYDKVGNVVKRIPEEDAASYNGSTLNGNTIVQDDSCIVYWDATNSNNRQVGNGTYLGVLRVVYTTEGVKPITDIRNLLLGVKKK